MSDPGIRTKLDQLYDDLKEPSAPVPSDVEAMCERLEARWADGNAKLEDEAAAMLRLLSKDAERWRKWKELATVRLTGRKLYATQDVYGRPDWTVQREPNTMIIESPPVRHEYEIYGVCCLFEPDLRFIDNIIDAALAAKEQS